MNSNPVSIIRVLGAVALTASCLSAHASAPVRSFSFSGHASLNTDVIRTAFTIGQEVSDVKVWTDSWQHGLNFDPTLALWRKTGPDYVLLTQVDDDDTVSPGQGAFDAGISLASLAAGQYLVTLTASPNQANGPALSDGFALDGSTPIPIALWDQPGYDLNTNDQKGTFWRIHGEFAVSAVPEPSRWLLTAMTIMLWGGIAEKKRRER